MVVFISGVHGTGKTYLCEKHAALRNEIIHESSSALIKRAKNGVNWSVEKRVSDVDENQIALTQEVKKITANGQKLILDGHTVLLGEQGQYLYISPSIFSQLNIIKIILIESEIEVISQRLINRDSTKNITDIEEFVRVERKQAKLVAESLSIPLEILVSPTVAEFSAAVDHAFLE